MNYKIYPLTKIINYVYFISHGNKRRCRIRVWI